MIKITSGEEFAKNLLKKIEEVQKINAEVDEIVEKIEESLRRIINKPDLLRTSLCGGIRFPLEKEFNPAAFRKVQALYGEVGWSLNFATDRTMIVMITQSLVDIADKVFQPTE